MAERISETSLFFEQFQYIPYIKDISSSLESDPEQILVTVLLVTVVGRASTEFTTSA